MNDNDPIPRSDAELAIIRTQTTAVTRLLLGRGKLGNGAIISAGDRLGMERRIALGQAAVASNTDLVHLEFGYDAHGDYRPRGIVLILPRDGQVYIQTDCQLYVGKPGSRALILPQPHVRGAFRLAKHELIHQPGKPANPATGIARAARLLGDTTPADLAADRRFHLLDVASA